MTPGVVPVQDRPNNGEDADHDQENWNKALRWAIVQVNSA